MDTLTIQDVTIPKLGYGTWELSGDAARQATATAIEVGFRHIDTAAVYGNEREVGDALADSGLPRDELFVTTKIWTDAIEAGRQMEAMDESLQRLGLEHVDLVLLHWPLSNRPVADQVGPLGDIQKSGKARLIGVSNYTTSMLDEAVKASDVPLAAIQVEYHPHLDQSKLLCAAREHDMMFTSYAPLGQGELLNNPEIMELAKDKGVTPAQYILRWHMQQENVTAIPKASSRGHMEENFDIFGFELNDAEMTRLFDMARPDGRVVDPKWAPAWD